MEATSHSVSTSQLQEIANYYGLYFVDREVEYEDGYPSPATAFCSVVAATIGLPSNVVAENLSQSDLDPDFVWLEFGQDDNMELNMAIHPSNIFARPITAWVAAVAHGLNMEIVVIRTPGTAARFACNSPDRSWGFIVIPPSPRARIVVATSSMSWWQRVTQPRIGDSTFWNDYIHRFQAFITSNMQMRYASEEGRGHWMLPNGGLSEELYGLYREYQPIERVSPALSPREVLEDVTIRRQRPRFDRRRTVAQSERSTSLQDFFADPQVGSLDDETGQWKLCSEAWKPTKRLDFVETSERIKSNIERQGGEMYFERIVDIDGYFILSTLENTPQVFREGLLILFRPTRVNENFKVISSIQTLLHAGGYERKRPSAVCLGEARNTLGRKDAKLYLVVPGLCGSDSDSNSDIPVCTDEILVRAVQFALRLPCTEDYSNHRCPNPVAIAHHKSNSTVKRDSVTTINAQEVIGPRVASCFVYHLAKYLRALCLYWTPVVIARNYDIKKSSVAGVAGEMTLEVLINTLESHLHPSFAKVFLVDIAVQACPMVRDRAELPLFAFWTRSLIQKLLFADRPLDTYGLFFTRDLACYQGPAGAVRLGEVKLYSTMFRLLTVGAGKIPVRYQGIAQSLLRALPEGLRALKKAAAAKKKVLSGEIELLMKRVRGLDGPASLRFEATLDIRDLVSHANLILSRVDECLGTQDRAVLDRRLIERFFDHYVHLIAEPLELRLVTIATLLQSESIDKVREEVCTVAALESMVTRVFWSGQLITRVGDILFNKRSLISLRLTEGFEKFNQLDMSGLSWDIDRMSLADRGNSEFRTVIMRSVERIMREGVADGDVSANKSATMAMQAVELVFEMRNGEQSLDIRCAELWKNYAILIARKLKLGADALEDTYLDGPAEILGEGGRARIGERFSVCRGDVTISEAIELVFDVKNLKWAAWKVPYLYGYQELKRVTLRARIDLESRMAQVGEALGIRYVHYSDGDTSRFYPYLGRFRRVRVAVAAATAVAVGGGGRASNGSQYAFFRKLLADARARVGENGGIGGERTMHKFTGVEEVHLVVGLNRYGEDFLIGILRDPTLIFFHEALRDGISILEEMQSLMSSNRLALEDGIWMLDRRVPSHGDALRFLQVHLYGGSGGADGRGRLLPRLIPRPIMPATGVVPSPSFGSMINDGAGGSWPHTLQLTTAPAGRILLGKQIEKSKVTKEKSVLTAEHWYDDDMNMKVDLRPMISMPTCAETGSGSGSGSVNYLQQSLIPLIEGSGNNIMMQSQGTVLRPEPVAVSIASPSQLPVLMLSPAPTLVANDNNFPMGIGSSREVGNGSGNGDGNPKDCHRLPVASEGLFAALSRLAKEVRPGRSFTSSEILRRFNSRIRPKAEEWAVILQKLEEAGAMEIVDTKGKKRKEVRFVDVGRIGLDCLSYNHEHEHQYREPINHLMDIQHPLSAAVNDANYNGNVIIVSPPDTPSPPPGDRADDSDTGVGIDDDDDDSNSNYSDPIIEVSEDEKSRSTQLYPYLSRLSRLAEDPIVLSKGVSAEKSSDKSSDVDADLSDDGINRIRRHRHRHRLPHTLSRPKRAMEKERDGYQKFSEEEILHLVVGINYHGDSSFARIADDPFLIFYWEQIRCNVSLKDKKRGLQKSRRLVFEDGRWKLDGKETPPYGMLISVRPLLPIGPSGEEVERTVILEPGDEGLGGVGEPGPRGNGISDASQTLGLGNGIGPGFGVRPVSTVGISTAGISSSTADIISAASIISPNPSPRTGAPALMATLRVIARKKVGESMSLTELSRRLNSRVRPRQGDWKGLLQQLGSAGAIRVSKEGLATRIEFVRADLI